MNKLSEINKGNKLNEGMSKNPDKALTPLVESLDPKVKECLMDVLKPNKTSSAITEENGTNTPDTERVYVKDFDSFVQENRNNTI